MRLIAELEETEKPYVGLCKIEKEKVRQLNSNSVSVYFIHLNNPYYHPVKETSKQVSTATRALVNKNEPRKAYLMYTRESVLAVLKDLRGSQENEKAQGSLDFSVSDDVSKAISDLEKRKRELLRLSALKKEVEELEKGLLK